MASGHINFNGECVTAEPGTVYTVSGYGQGNIKRRNRHAKTDTAHKQRKIICFNLELVLYKSITQ